MSKLDVDEHIKIEIGEEELDEVEFSKKENNNISKKNKEDYVIVKCPLEKEEIIEDA